MNKKLILTIFTLVTFVLTLTLASASHYSHFDGNSDFYTKDTHYEVKKIPYYTNNGHGTKTITTKTTITDRGSSYNRYSYQPSFNNLGYYSSNSHYPTYTGWRDNRAYNNNDYRYYSDYKGIYNKPYYYKPKYDYNKGYYLWRY
jgi:hypothetical protein